MYACIKCDRIVCTIPKKLICTRCGFELRERTHYLNGKVYQGEMYATITFILDYFEEKE